MNMESIIKVNLPQNPYEIAIAPSGLASLGQRCSHLNLGKKVMVVSNPVVFEHYGDRTIASLEGAGFEVCTCILPDGEQYKHLGSIQKVYDLALENRLERSSTLVALGGGVIGDMTGFAAATWLRGVNFVQVPTTLLAMVDASMGGKTGVNHPQGKNLIGAFYQPRLVLIDPDVLQTLPVREFRAGMAEVIKYGIIWDEQLFERLEQSDRLDDMSCVSGELLQDILQRSCQAKADVVGKDERESGLRAILNYGHTIGHAIESITNYQLVNHGEAVAIGMVTAGKLAVELGLWTPQASQRQDAVIHKTGLPTTLPPGLDLAQIVDLLYNDKKVKAGKVRFILPTKIGATKMVDDVSDSLIQQVLEACRE
jgi:3-dehydroquinate synthase